MNGVEPTAVEIGLERLGGLTRAGATPGRVVEAAGEIVAGRAEEAEMDADTAQARIGPMWDSLSRDAAELEEQIGDSDGGDAAALSAAKQMLAAMQAAVGALGAAHRRFQRTG